jgi:uncharacterized membrane protein
MRASGGHPSILHSIALILLGLILFGVLAAILETLGLKNHPYMARTLSAVIIAVGAYIHWGYHNWWAVLIVICIWLCLSADIKTILWSVDE